MASLLLPLHQHNCFWRHCESWKMVKSQKWLGECAKLRLSPGTENWVAPVQNGVAPVENGFRMVQKTLSGFCSLSSKDLSHFILATFGNLPFSGSLPELSDCHACAMTRVLLRSLYGLLELMDQNCLRITGECYDHSNCTDRSLTFRITSAKLGHHSFWGDATCLPPGHVVPKRALLTQAPQRPHEHQILVGIAVSPSALSSCLSLSLFKLRRSNLLCTKEG